MLAKKEELERVLQKKNKLKKLLEEEQTTYIFMNDSIDASMDKKIKSLNRQQELKKENAEYNIKVKETKELYYNLIYHSKENQNSFN